MEGNPEQRPHGEHIVEGKQKCWKRQEQDILKFSLISLEHPEHGINIFQKHDMILSGNMNLEYGINIYPKMK